MGDLRPSVKYPTLESRICDLPMTVDETVAIAALIQALVARLADHHRRNHRGGNYPVAFIQENKWRPYAMAPMPK